MLIDSGSPGAPAAIGISLTINGEARELQVAPWTTLLDLLREDLDLTGTKKGCDHGQCGACTVHIDGTAVRSCSMPVSSVTPDQKIVTIEGLSKDRSHPVQKAWAELDVPQCGFCIPGFVMATVALLRQNRDPGEAEIVAAQCLDGRILPIDVAALVLDDGQRIAGDLFLDCTGHAALLIEGYYGIGTVDRGGTLFNDRALAVQVPVAANSPIASQTNATAHAAGWIWDIGLPSRRGIGCVYASDFLNDDAAEATLRDYLSRAAPDADQDALSFRQLRFRSAHRERFWQGNCLAIGLSAGFLEPLEASAIVLIELSIDALLFLIATLSSYFALRIQGTTRLHWLERIADTTFILAMLLLTAACFIITYALNR